MATVSSLYRKAIFLIILFLFFFLLHSTAYNAGKLNLSFPFVTCSNALHLRCIRPLVDLTKFACCLLFELSKWCIGKKSEMQSNFFLMSGSTKNFYMLCDRLKHMHIFFNNLRSVQVIDLV